MQNTEINSKFKDEKPLNTISKIKTILNDLNINIYEKSWNSINDNCYSVRIEIDGLFGIGTNGKGTSRAFASASAYAELMERLQNRKTLSKTYCNKPKDELSFPDERQCTIKELTEHEFILKHLIKGYNRKSFANLILNYKSLGFCEPYFDVKNQRVNYLPGRIINLACGTNGMCAGNTKEEALVGGICEIMERYAMKQIILNDIILPTIPANSIKYLKIYDLITSLGEKGFKVFVKDCSLNGMFPVVGVLVINENTTKYHFKLGAFPVLEIAIERCLTEMFQGYDLRTSQRFQYIDITTSNYTRLERLELIRQNAISRGQFPNSIFEFKEVDDCHEKIFLRDFNDNKTGLNHLLKIIQREKLDLFIRNVSFLGFPSYRIYIPNLSEISQLSIKTIQTKFALASAERDILNLATISNVQLNNIAEYIKRSLEAGNNTLGQTGILKRINLNGIHKLEETDNNFILTLIYIKIKNYDKAITHLKQYINSHLKYDTLALKYYMCALNYLKYKNESIANISIKKNLIPLFGEKITDEVMTDLRGETIFKHLSLPNAPNCNECHIAEECNFSTWKKITCSITERMKNDFPNQGDIEIAFQNN